MRYNTAYPFRFDPTAEQKAALAEGAGHTRYVWSWALDLRTQSYSRRDPCGEGKSLTYTDTAKRLTTLKRDDDPQWLSDALSVALTKDPAGRYFVRLTCPEEQEPLPETDRAVGIDLGITDVVVTSDGFKSGNPKHLDNDLYRLKTAQRRLSRKEEGSENWTKQKRSVARLHARVADQRNDVLHKLSRKLVDENQTICLETLNVKGMQRREASAASVQNRSLSRSIADTGWSTLVQYMEYKAERAGRTVVKIDRWFPSTKRCSGCGHVGEPRPLSVRRWPCKECGERHDRDVNAAKNIRTVGLAGAQTFLREDSGGHSKTRDAFVLNADGPSKE